MKRLGGISKLCEEQISKEKLSMLKEDLYNLEKGWKTLFLEIDSAGEGNPEKVLKKLKDIRIKCLANKINYTKDKLYKSINIKEENKEDFHRLNCLINIGIICEDCNFLMIDNAYVEFTENTGGFFDKLLDEPCIKNILMEDESINDFKGLKKEINKRLQANLIKIRENVKLYNSISTYKIDLCSADMSEVSIYNNEKVNTEDLSMQILIQQFSGLPLSRLDRGVLKDLGYSLTFEKVISTYRRVSKEVAE